MFAFLKVILNFVPQKDCWQITVFQRYLERENKYDEF